MDLHVDIILISIFFLYFPIRKHSMKSFVILKTMLNLQRTRERRQLL